MKKIFTLLVIAFAMVGCTNHEEKDEVVLPVLNETFYASFADFEELSRTYIDKDIKLLWHADDRISLFRTTLNEEFVFTGNTGDNSGGFNAVPSDSWVTGNQTSTNYAVYPYLASTRLSNQEDITVVMPAVQEYAENSFGRGANTMVAASENSSSRFLPFRNLGGYLVVKLYGEGVSVKSIELVGNNEEVLAGVATVQAKYGYLPSITMSEDGTQSVTLDCGAGVELSADPANPTLFWLVVPPTIFEGGFTLTITNTLGGETIKSTTKKQTIERNGVKSMSAFEVYGGGPRPKNNEIWYTNGSTTEATTPNKTDAFGVNIVSNTYDAEQECWVLKFDGAVTSIGEKAFYKCSNLTSATISDSVTSIGDYAFYCCKALTGVIIGNSVTSIGADAFYYCRSLISITIPDSVTEIGPRAFNACEALTNVTIGDSVTSIGHGAFYFCDSLTSVTIPDSVTSIGKVFAYCSSLKAFYGKFASADNCCLIQDNTIVAYAHASGSTYTIPDGVTEIGEFVFVDCDSLTSITIPDSVTSIGKYAFMDCTSLTSVTIGNSVTSIGDNAFYGCSSLTSITIPDSVTWIGGVAFCECSSLTAFYGKFASADNRCLIVDGKLNSFAPNGLTTYSIPDGVTSIGHGAFASCSSLTSVTIPDSVTSIGDFAFSQCTSLTSVTIGNGVTSIEHCAFQDCNSLKEVYCKPTTPPTLDYDVFYNNASGRKIYVPAASVEAYKSATNWSTYAADIQEYEYIPKPASNEIWYTNGSTTKATTPYATDVFGANIVSNTYDAEQECWVLKFDGDITSIGVSAFWSCTSLTSITIPDSVTSIGSGAFVSCSSLTSITIPDSVTSIGDGAFGGCSSITSITIPDSVTSIGNSAFYDCTSLTSVTISDSVTSIGASVFRNCTSLKEFKGKFASADNRCLVVDGVLNSFAPSGLTTYTIPDSVTSIGDTAFYGCSSLTSVTIGDNVTSIGNNAVRSCTSLKEFKGKFASTDNRCLVVDGVLQAFAPSGLTTYTIPDSVTSIGENAFSHCTSLTSITIPDSVTSIGYDAFGSCTSLTSVTIPDSVTSIGWYAFGSCTSLTRVDITDLSAWCKISFGGSSANPCCYGAKLYLNGEVLTDITIPSDITEIKGCAFDRCTSLTSVTIPDSVTSIGYFAFSHCTSLTSITIPDSVTSIGDYAFDSCTSLKEVYCKPTTPPTGGYDMFNNNASGRKIYVPAASVEAYKSATNWSTYAADIVDHVF